MQSRSNYSSITLTSLLDVVFIVLFLVLLNLGAGYRSATTELTAQTERNAAQMTVALLNADETVRAAATANVAANATIKASNAADRANARSTMAALAVAATSVARSAQADKGLAATRVAAAQATLHATATAWAVAAQRANEEKDGIATYVSLTSASALAAQATAAAALATAEVRNGEALSVEATVAARETEVVAAAATTDSLAQAAQQMYQEAQQIVAAETEDPGITLAKARWIDKYGNFYLIRLSPVIDGRSSVEIFRNDNFLTSSQVSTEAQIHELLTILDRGDVADTLVILKFSGASSDNHRQWILRYLDNYSFKYQRIQEGKE